MEELIGEPSAAEPDAWTAAQQAKWRELARTWHEAPAPASPSRDDLVTFVSLVERHCRPDGAVAIMGCTPSLRSALFSSDVLRNARTYCVDFSSEMWAATSARLDGQHSREQFVQGTWHDLASALPEAVDVVLGDKSLDNVEFARWPALFEAIHDALLPGGHLVAHVGLVVRDPTPLDVERVLATWCAHVRDGVPEAEAASGFWEELLTGSVCGERPADPHTLSVAIFGDDLEAMRRRAAHGSLEQRLLERFDDLFGSSLDDAWTAFTLDELLRVAGVRFVPRAAYWSRDYEVAPLQPILDFEARRKP